MRMIGHRHRGGRTWAPVIRGRPRQGGSIRQVAAPLVVATTLVGLLGGCSQGPVLTLVLRERASDWPAGLEATLAVVAAPFAEEVTLASTGVDADGSFALAVAAPEAELLRSVTTIYPDLPECSTEISEPAQRLLFLADFTVLDPSQRPLGRLLASQLRAGGERIVSLGFLYVDVDGRVNQRCEFDDASFVIALELRAGWNPFLIEAPVEPGETPGFEIATAPVANPFSWRYQQGQDPPQASHGGDLTPFLQWATKFVTPVSK